MVVIELNYMITYITKDGDVLDSICWKYYGKTSGMLEKVLEANRHLAELGAIFSASVKIILPDLKLKKKKQKASNFGRESSI
jgi:phage tail protein X